MYKLPIALFGLLSTPFLAAFAFQEVNGPVYSGDPWDKLAQYGAMGLILVAVGLGIREGWTFFKTKMWPDFQGFLAKITGSIEAQTSAVREQTTAVTKLTDITVTQHQQIIDAIHEHDGYVRNGKHAG